MAKKLRPGIVISQYIIFLPVDILLDILTSAFFSEYLYIVFIWKCKPCHFTLALFYFFKEYENDISQTSC